MVTQNCELAVAVFLFYLFYLYLYIVSQLTIMLAFFNFRLVEKGEVEKAAAIAVFFLKMKKALEILSFNGMNTTNGV